MTFNYTLLNSSFQNNQRQWKYHVKIKLRRYRFKLLCSAGIITILLLYIFGVFTHLLELDYETNFSYPLSTPNFRYLIETVKLKLHSSELATPLNNFTFAYNYSPAGKCVASSASIPPSPLTLLIVVKSAVCNYRLRAAIRQTWGYEKRFADVNIRTVFVLGRCPPTSSSASTTSSRRSRTSPITTTTTTSSQCTITSRLSPLFATKAFTWLPKCNDSSTAATTDDSSWPKLSSSSSSPSPSEPYPLDCQQLIDAEYAAHQDLVQAEFTDSYYNNTLKTMATLHWTVTHCSQVPFLLFVDDDYYVSVKNLLKFTRNFLRRAAHGSEVDDGEDDVSLEQAKSDNRNEYVHFDGRLYTGFVFPHSRPMRHLPSKWYISLAEYPFSRYPPYVTGGCFLLNNHTVADLHYASLYTAKFKYDDVYLGILAHKMGVRLVHNPHMYFHKYGYEKAAYREVIASHGYGSPEELITVWEEQKAAGNA
ncbi:Beta-1,3-galactosyltransferase 1 [Tyrophagus putrescentiae]|nr:Beta-1,3-galactosyltransferase 1 [Tyrophagus putrescentiae]